MSEALRVTLLANAGLLLEYEGTTLLLDGIFHSRDVPFSSLPQDVWQKLLRGDAPFGKIDYLLFTHHHPDHFSAAMTVEYLEGHPIKGVFLPDAEELENSTLMLGLREHGTPCALLSDQTNHAVYKVAPNITVRAFRTLHLDKAFETVRHYCYLITFGDKRVLFTADVNYLGEDLSQTHGAPLHAAFINPLFFSALSHHRFFKGELNPKHLCVYHVPFAEDDPFDMNVMLRRDLAQRDDVIVLREALQQIEL